ncbi:hypothetical protein AAY473_005813 [Plecturocebus cupreus]
MIFTEKEEIVPKPEEEVTQKKKISPKKLKKQKLMARGWGQAGLELLTSGDPPALASKVLGLQARGQAGLELLTSGDPPALASKVLGLQASFGREDEAILRFPTSSHQQMSAERHGLGPNSGSNHLTPRLLAAT